MKLKEPEGGRWESLGLAEQSHGAILVALEIGDGVQSGEPRARTTRRFCAHSQSGSIRIDQDRWSEQVNFFYNFTGG